ncbi:hypothetical protein Bca52824_010941 [Brassica carinata]|uniref:Uncharacterized protein n=1 Tax=Brassica carinata TaxID=52824 RepID=A0A8X7WH17_BRACI|nr:hypothetical protein Bca52824_010941 [Brassica carinata]
MRGRRSVPGSAGGLSHGLLEIPVCMPTSEVTFFDAIKHIGYRITAMKTWEFLFLFTPKMPLNIQQRVVINGQIIYGVDEDGQIFYFTPSTNPMFMTNGIVEPNPENRNEYPAASTRSFGAMVCGDLHEEMPGRRGVVGGLGEH